MSTDYYEAESSVRPRRSLLPLLVVPLLAFIAGIAAMGWLLTHWTRAAEWIGVQAPVRTVQPAPAPVRPMTVVTEPAVPASGAAQRLVIDPEISRRVGQLEQKMGQIDLQTRTAAGSADRAEGLLVAFAARRALDRGVGLGYLEGLLQRRFGATQPEAVATVITTSRHPVTLEELQEGLHNVAPDLTGGGPNQSWWSAFKTELAGLVTVRKGGMPSSMPSERVTRAMDRLEAGKVDVALTEVNRLPGRDKAAAWIADARRYVAARRALDTLETAALLEPRMPPGVPPPPPAASAPAPADG